MEVLRWTSENIPRDEN